MRKVSFLFLSAFLAFAIGCGSSKPKDLIVGKWESTEDKTKGEVVEFKSDGTMVMTMGDGDKKASMTAKYKFLEDELMEVEMENPLAGLDAKMPKTLSQKIKIKVTKDELTTTDDGGKVIKAKRVK